MTVVKTANPASWHTTEGPRAPPAGPVDDAVAVGAVRVRRVAAGRGHGDRAGRMGRLRRRARSRSRSGTVRIGLDLGTKEDTTGIVVALHRRGRRRVDPAGAGAGPAAREGRRAPQVRDPRRGARARGGIRGVAGRDRRGDRRLGVRRRTSRTQFDLEVVAHSQKPAIMAEAAERFYTAVREEKLRHPRDPVFTRHVLNAHRRGTDDGRWRFVKENKQSQEAHRRADRGGDGAQRRVEESETPAPTDRGVRMTGWTSWRSRR